MVLLLVGETGRGIVARLEPDGYCVGRRAKWARLGDGWECCSSYLEWNPAMKTYTWLASSKTYATHFTWDVALELADRVGGVVILGIDPPTVAEMPADEELSELTTVQVSETH